MVFGKQKKDVCISKLFEIFANKCKLKEICIQKFGVEILLLLGVLVILDYGNIYVIVVPGNYDFSIGSLK